MSNITNKVIAITGASGGIGEATAILLAARGAKLAIGARRGDRLEKIVSRIEAAGGEAIFHVMDVASRDDVTAFVDAACARFGRLDVYINNAGVAPNSMIDDLAVEDWRRMMDVNVMGPLYGIAAALPIFRRQEAGHFVNLLSTAGLVIKPTMAVYAGSKQAMRAITEGLRQEAGPKLRVTAISPGFIQTGLAGSMTNAEVRTSIQKTMDEMAITPDAIARAIAFAIEQPADVDVSEIVVRPTAQG